MKKTSQKLLSTILALLLLFPVLAGPAFAYPNSKWDEYKSGHFVIHYQPDTPHKYVQALARKSEGYYRSIAERLNFKRFNFWTWENRARIFIYDSKEAYIRDRGRPKCSLASVQVKSKTISTYYSEEHSFETVLPHEIAHIVLRELIGFQANVPLWFEEGVACANEEGYRNYLLTAKRLLEQECYLPVEEMEQIANPAVKAKSETLFYPLAASLVIFLLEDYGKEDFIRLCRELRDGSTFYGALAKIYGIETSQQLNTKFLTWLD